MISFRWLSLPPMVLAGSLAAVWLLAGCAAGGQWKNPLTTASIARFLGPSEAAFWARVDHQCAAKSIGGQRVGALLAGDKSFRTLTRQLYFGEISNDEYLDLLLAQHPARDGNVAGAGCVSAQVNACLRGDCAIPAARPDQPAAAAPRPTAKGA